MPIARYKNMKNALVLLLACTLPITHVLATHQRPFALTDTAVLYDPTPEPSDNNTSPSYQDCGYFGIDKPECEARNCYWKPVHDHPGPWCVFKGDDGVDGYTCAVDPATREDCGFFGIDEQGCRMKNCCWNPRPDIQGTNYCFYRRRLCTGYSLTSPPTNTPTGLSATLRLSSPCEHYGQDLSHLRLTVVYETATRLRVKITDPSEARYEIPEELVPTGKIEPSVTEEERLYRFNYTDGPFGFSVSRVAEEGGEGETIFDTKAGELVFERQYIEVATGFAQGTFVYGLGEVVHSLKRDTTGTWQTIWARDAMSPLDENVYGSHPFYLGLNNGTAYGVFLRNSNAMDVVITPRKLTWKVIGGVLDFYIFLGPTPDAVIDQYTEVVGRPAMPPYWSLGFHHCRYGFKNIEAVETTVRGYREGEIPLEAIWIDIDYMSRFRDFTLDKHNFPLPRVSAFIADLHARGQRIVAIVDPGIKIEKGYAPFETGLEEEVFVRNALGRPIIGSVWPGYTLFPDFMSNKTQVWWENTLQSWMEEVPVDGIWIDMNEPVSWCDGECSISDLAPLLPLLPSPPTVPPHTRNKHTYEDVTRPRYRVRNAGAARAPLHARTLAVDAVHEGGFIEYDVHNLFGHAEAIATRKALLAERREGVRGKKRERPFLLTRSSFSGTGAHSAHWLGDNWSDWLYLYLSMPGIMNFQLFGIPFTGADICGFSGATTEELCLRWMQLGAFFPFARNHNAIGEPDQAPYLWESVKKASRDALTIRYALLPYLYTLFRAAHTSGTPVWRPLFFDFPHDPETPHIDRQVLLGRAALLSPALHPGQKSVKAYFPPGRWYDYHTLSLVLDNSDDPRGVYRQVPAPLEIIPIHLRGGFVVPMQEPGLTTETSRMGNYYLLVPLNARGMADGVLYLDDGVSEDIVAAETSEIRYSAWVNGEGGEVRAEGRFGYMNVHSYLTRVVVFGVGDKLAASGSDAGNMQVRVDERVVAAEEGTRVELDVRKGILVVDGLKLNMTQGMVIRWDWQ